MPEPVLVVFRQRYGSYLLLAGASRFHIPRQLTAYTHLYRLAQVRYSRPVTAYTHSFIRFTE
ncbi:MAG: hypothetical protein ACFNZV_09525 [Rothia dentocariosa]